MTTTFSLAVEFKFNRFKKIASGDVTYFGDETRNEVCRLVSRDISDLTEREQTYLVEFFGKLIPEKQLEKGFFEALG